MMPEARTPAVFCFSLSGRLLSFLVVIAGTLGVSLTGNLVKWRNRLKLVKTA
jgi:hypothetical protein